jgi:predicted GIY-YIG superfamily endonuclease
MAKPARGTGNCPNNDYIDAMFSRVNLRLRPPELEVLERLSQKCDKSSKGVLLDGLLALARRHGVEVPAGFGVNRGAKHADAQQDTFSVYAILDESGNPRYVGRTRKIGKRINEHLSGRSSLQVSAWVRQEAELGRKVAVVSLADGLGYHEAKRAEQNFIRKFRGRFSLLNKRGKVH